MNQVNERIADKSTYQLWEPVTLRYCDTDALGHINNVAFAALFEAGRAALLFNGVSAVSPPGTTFVIITINIHYRAEMHFPGTANIGTALASFGNSSVKLQQAIFKGDVCCATAESTLVLIDEGTRRPITIAPETRKLIEQRSAGIV